MKALKRHVERRYRTRFWGQMYLVRPMLISHVFGDGKQLIAITPLATRPDHYAVRVDSSWVLSNWDDSPAPHIADYIDEILDAIEDDFGRAWYEDEHPNRKYGRPWPALNDSCGVSWCEWELPPTLERLLARSRSATPMPPHAAALSSNEKPLEHGEAHD